MLDEQTKADLLASVNESIIRKAKAGIIIGSPKTIGQVAGITSGQLRIFPSLVKKFRLIIISPLSKAFAYHEIRCCVCEKIISYPCWYYEVKYAVNHFHYFICFDASQSDRPTTRCYRKGE